ncbi:MAG: WYL domain-containing protein [Pirellulales bacterium]
MAKKKSAKRPLNIPTKKSDGDRRLRQAARLADHLRLLQLLLGRYRWDYRSLAAELECAERTIRRRLEVLELAGVPTSYDPQQRVIRVLPGTRFPVVQLTRDELLEQATATVLTSARGLDVAASVPATEKLAALSSDEVSQLLADAQQVMDALDLRLADHSQHHQILKTIQWALIERRQLAGSYKSPYQEQPVDLTLHPIRLCLTGQAWYLIAQPTDRASPRTYRVTRFQTARRLDAAAVIPGDFDLNLYFGNAWNVFRGDQSYEVEIEFTPDAAEIVTETVWHKTQQVQRNNDGSVCMRFTVDGLDEIVWWVLGWSGRVRVIKPEALRIMVVKRLEEALRLQRS